MPNSFKHTRLPYNLIYGEMRSHGIRSFRILRKKFAPVDYNGQSALNYECVYRCEIGHFKYLCGFAQILQGVKFLFYVLISFFFWLKGHHHLSTSPTKGSWVIAAKVFVLNFRRLFKF